MSRFGTITIDISKQLDALSSAQRKVREAAEEMVSKTVLEDRNFTKEEQTKYDALAGEIVSLGERADRIRSMPQLLGNEEPKSRTKPDKLTTPDEEEEKRKSDRNAHRQAFNSWLRYGFNGMSSEERDIMSAHASPLTGSETESRAMSAVLGSGGGFTCPNEVQAQIEIAMKDFSGIEQIGATTISTSTGNDLPWPTTNDTSNEGVQLEENGTVAESNPTFGNATMKAFTFSSNLVLVPVQLLQDSAVNMESIVAKMLGERLGRITNRRFTTGTGANQPQGVVTGSVLGKTVAGAAAVTFEELIDLEISVDPAYRARAGWMFHDSTFGALRKLKDGDGRPIWQPAAQSGLAAGAPGTLMGYPYVCNNNMAAMGTGNKSILFGAFEKYKIRKVKGITLVRLAERYAEKLQVGLYAFMRCDGRIIDAGTNPIKHILHP